MQTIQPSARQLFCRPEETETQTRSGFLLTKQAQDKPMSAEIINIGKDVKEYKSGDHIIYKPYSVTEIRLNKTVTGYEEYFLVDEEDILGKIIEVKE